MLRVAARLDFRKLNGSQIRRAFLARGGRRCAERRLAEAAAMLIATRLAFSREL